MNSPSALKNFKLLNFLNFKISIMKYPYKLASIVYINGLDHIEQQNFKILVI